MFLRNSFCVFLLIGLFAMVLANPTPADEKPADPAKKAETPVAATDPKKPDEKEKVPEKTEDKAKTPEKEKAAEKKDSKDKENEEKTGVSVTSQTWDTYFTGSAAMGTLGALVLVGALGFGYYYFYYLQYYGYTSNSGLYGNQQYPNYQQQQYYSNPVARSLDTSSKWNWNQVLSMIALAEESYDKFDFQTLECQKKAMCELSHKNADLGETGEKVSKAFTSFSKRFLYVVDGLPMPTIILNYLKEYREAMNQSEDCSTVYPTCNFSMKEVIGKYEERMDRTSTTGVVQKL